MDDKTTTNSSAGRTQPLNDVPADDDFENNAIRMAAVNPEHEADASHVELTQPSERQVGTYAYYMPAAEEDGTRMAHPSEPTLPHPAARTTDEVPTQRAARQSAPVVPSPVPVARESVPPAYVPEPGVRSAAYPPRKNWSLVAIAMFAIAATLVFGGMSLVALRMLSLGSAAAQAVTADAVTATVIPTFDMVPPTVGVELLPWNGTERFTILMLGLDKRPGETGTAFRTDSMILISIDPLTRSVGMLSIPRDLYIELPPGTVVSYGYGLQRVNSAYVIGELAQPGFGPQLTMQTVQYNLGIRVHDYVAYDFTAVIDGINAVGGIDINVEQAIYDPEYPDMYYGYDPLYIPAGPTHMDGVLALKYARSRHSSSDLVRARRQQQVIRAVRDRVLNANLLPDLLVQAPGLWASWSRNIKTGLTLDQMIQLALYLKDISPENIRQGVIDSAYVTPTMWDGASVLVPNRAAIGSLMVQVFGANYNQ